MTRTAADNRPSDAPAEPPFVDDVFDLVAGLPTEEQEAAIADRCAGFPDVAREVRRLLDFVQPTEEPPPEPIAGARIGRFLLAECVGRGSSGSVWRAFDERLQAWTALKVFDSRRAPSADGSTAIDAPDGVLREARAASGILSDHVIRVKDAGRLPGGRPYIEMQLCAEYRPGPDGDALVVGRSLSDDRPRDLHETVRIVAEAARGVDDAHRIGVVHRDLKPANILLLPVSRRALVTDFGLAAAGRHAPANRESSPSATVTVVLDGPNAGVLVGTPAYMAPEHAHGAVPGRSSDIYALGATLYALIRGRPPYQPTGRHPIPAMDVVEQVRAGPPLALPLTIPRRLAKIVEKAMARDPADRYPTAAALAADLDAWRTDHPSTVDAGNPALALALFARRNQGVVSLVLGLAAILLVFAGALFWLDGIRHDLVRDVSEAQIRRGEAERIASEAETLRDRALAEQARALAERERALAESAAAAEARNAALLGQDEATRRAAFEIRARSLAEEARRKAELARVDAERVAAEETDSRAHLEARLREELAARAWVDEQLAASEQARRSAESERDGLAEERARLQTEVEQLRARLDAIAAAAAAPTAAPR